jgi:hypothetical protein
MEDKMTAAYISLHKVRQVRARSIFPCNSAALTIVLSGDDGEVEICIFGLPEDRALHIANVLGDDDTIVFEGTTSTTMKLYLETKDVFEALEGRKKENDHE